MRPHLDHPDFLEIAVYEDEIGFEAIRVECTKCGMLLHELYNRENDHGQDASPSQQER
jgi:hypothetical protein